METSPQNVSLLKLLSEPGQSLASVTKAIKGGADVNETSPYGFTPLMFAALLNDDVEIVRALLDEGAYIDAETEDGMTALMWALMTETQDHVGHDVASALSREENRRAVAMEILTRGPDVNTVCFSARWKKWTPLLFASRDPDRNTSIISILIEAGANINARTDEELTPLILVSAYGRSPDPARTLIEAGADVDAAGKQEGREGWTALLYALNSPYKSLPIVKELVLGKADVNVTLPSGNTPLFFALNLGDDPAFTELLLNAGADVRALDSEGNSLFDWALAKDYKRIARLLSKAEKTGLIKARNGD